MTSSTALYVRLWVILWCCSWRLYADLSPYELHLVQDAIRYSGAAPESIDKFNGCLPRIMPTSLVAEGVEHNILFTHFPGLVGKISYIHFGDFPTPIIFCPHLSALYPGVAIYLKHDGMTGPLRGDGSRWYGGNKLRKLSYVLAAALANGHTKVLTFGGVGSNHAVQTAVLAHQRGMQCICMLKDQPNSQAVRNNLLMHLIYGSHLNFASTLAQRADQTMDALLAYKQNYNEVPYPIATGCSTALGSLGYVQAAFELLDQINAGHMPRPDDIYLTLGSAGTAAGLLLGLTVADIPCRVYLIQSEPGASDRALAKVVKIYTETAQLLHAIDPTFPLAEFPYERVKVDNRYAGSRYGQFTPEGAAAERLMYALEGIRLDGVYTAKCLSGMLADIKVYTGAPKVVLFWNTFCAHDVENEPEGSELSYRTLPPAFYRYFEQDVQELDRA